MAKDLMSDAEIRRRKKAQGHISQATGALGLASVGAFGASKLPGSKLARKVPRLKKINEQKAKDLALGTSTLGAGIGGAGSFNFASYTNAESRKRKSMVQKSYISPFEDALYSASDSEEIAKVGNWKTIEQREMSQGRSRKTMRGAGVVAGAGAGLAAMGMKNGGGAAFKQVGGAMKNVNAIHNAAKTPKLKRVADQASVVRRHIKGAMGGDPHGAGATLVGAGLVGTGAAVGGGAKSKHSYEQHKINQRRRKNFKKSAPSAFGVMHD